MSNCTNVKDFVLMGHCMAVADQCFECGSKPRRCENINAEIENMIRDLKNEQRMVNEKNSWRIGKDVCVEQRRKNVPGNVSDSRNEKDNKDELERGATKSSRWS